MARSQKKNKKIPRRSKPKRKEKNNNDAFRENSF